MIGFLKYFGMAIALVLMSNLVLSAGIQNRDLPLELPTIETNPVITPLCAGSKFMVSYTVSKDFDPGNIFTAQLSDGMGDFSNPTEIGSINSITSGTILVSLPKSLSAGSGYRIRVVGLAPLVIGADNGENITIYELPTMNIEGNFEPCSEESYTYNTNSEIGFAYSWSVTGAVIQGNNTSTTVYVLWGTDSVGTLQLVKRNLSTGCSDTMTIDISVKYPPITEIGFGEYEVCVGQIVEYVSAAGSVAADNWIAQGGTILSWDAAKARVKWEVAGEGWIEMHKTSEYGCKGKDRKTVFVNPVPIAQIYGSNNVYSDKRTLYKSMVQAGTGSLWQVRGGTKKDSTSDSVYITWEQPGEGWLRLVKYYKETDCSDTAEMIITINPALPIGEIVGKKSACSGKIEPYNTDEVQNTYIRWYVQGGSIIGADNGFNINVNWGASGSGEVKYVLTEFGSGNKDSVTLQVTINPTPEINFPQLSDICENDPPLLLNMAEPIGGGYTGNGVDLDYFYPNRAGAGSHEITYSFTNQFGCEGTQTRTIVVNPKPEKPIITAVENGFSSNYDEGNQWFLNGSAIAGATNKDIIIVENGVYSVQVTDSNGCVSDMSDGIEVSVDDYKKIYGIKIYPNPAGDFIYIENKTNLLIVRIEMVDVIGNFFHHIFLNNRILNAGKQELEIVNIPNGLYFIKLYIGSSVIAEKIIIHR